MRNAQFASCILDGRDRITAISGVDCTSASASVGTCVWDLGTTTLGGVFGAWPGGFLGAILGVPTLLPSPFGDLQSGYRFAEC